MTKVCVRSRKLKVQTATRNDIKSTKKNKRIYDKIFDD